MSKVELADFLRRRREALPPADGAAVSSHRARRTPGMRREEVARLAGVSTSYYERLEQARAPHPSAQVLSALGLALQLSPPEMEHLVRVAGLAPTGPPHDGEEIAGLDDAQRMLDRLGAIPAYLIDERQRIVGWNRAAAALIIDFATLPPAERTMARLSARLSTTLCSEPPADDGEFARAAAAELRAAHGRHPDDRVLGEQVNEFAAQSPQFVDGWRSHDVRPRRVLRKRFRHPELGDLELERQTLTVPGTDLQLVMHTAEPGSPSAAALARLGTPAG